MQKTTTISIRLNTEFLNKIKAEAKKQDRSTNYMIVLALKEKFVNQLTNNSK